jgi:hypothetical protein
MWFDMSKSVLESFVAASDLLVRVFAILAAISAVCYLFSSWRLQKATARAAVNRVSPEPQRTEVNASPPQSQDQIDKLKNENASLAAQLQQEQEARLDTEIRFGPRIVSLKAKPQVIATLQPFAGQKLNFGYFTDLETAEFAEDLLAAFKAAGWKPQVFKIKSIQPMYGVACGGPNPQDPALQALTEALKVVDKRVASEGSGTSVMGQTLQPQLTDQLQMWVMVGLKRPHLMRKPQSESEAQPQ